MRIGIPWCCCKGFLWACVALILVSNNEVNGVGELVKRGERRQIVSSECGAISAVDIQFDHHQVQFISLDPNSIFLPALLHAHMLLYVHTGSGKLSYTEGKEMQSRKVSKGDVYWLKSGSVFYVESGSQESSEQELELLAVFSEESENEQKEKERGVGPYSGIRDLFQGFDTRLLQAAFEAPEEVMEEIVRAAEMEPIVPAERKTTTTAATWKRETVLLKTLLEINGVEKDVPFLHRNNKKKKDKEESASFNLFKVKRQVDNCDGWSTMVNPKDLHGEEDGSTIGAFMLNLRPGAMAGPHWNPSATEIAVVVEGRGMVRAVCSSSLTRRECNNTRFVVERGDVLAIPRSHPMAHMSFNNESLVLMGFSLPTTTRGGGRASGPRFLAGKDSFLHVVDKRVLELALNVNSSTISRLLASKKADAIKACISCAEEEEERMIEEEQESREEIPEEERREEMPEEEEEEEDDDDEDVWDRAQILQGKERVRRMRRTKTHN